MMNEVFERPKENVPPTKNIKTINTIAFCLLIALWIFSFWVYTNAPNTVPIHFNANGKVDSYGNKFSILVLPLIGTFIFFLLKFLSNKPYLFNYPYTITKDNYANAYKSATSMLHFLKLLVIILFGIIQYMVYKAINNESTLYSTVAIFTIIIIMLVVPIVIATKTVKGK